MSKEVIPYPAYESLLIIAIQRVGNTPNLREIFNDVVACKYQDAIQLLKEAYSKSNIVAPQELEQAETIIQDNSFTISEKDYQLNEVETLLIECFFNLREYLVENTYVLSEIYSVPECSLAAESFWYVILENKLEPPKELVKACELLGWDMSTNPPHDPYLGKIEIDEPSENG